MKSHFLISDEEKNRIRNLHESRLQSFGTGNVIKEQWIKDQAQKQKYKEGEWGPIKKALGLLRPNELTRILKGCNIPISPKCKGKNILQDNDCLPQHILKMKMGCLAKAVRK
jgi:hypothetical protein